MKKEMTRCLKSTKSAKSNPAACLSTCEKNKTFRNHKVKNRSFAVFNRFHGSVTFAPLKLFKSQIQVYGTQSQTPPLSHP